jgi:hypothetical protein
MASNTFEAIPQMLLVLFDVLGHDGIPAVRPMT